MKNLFCLRAPPINPLNGKAQKLPIINPFDRHGRVFFFAWASFCCSFSAWYSFSPLSKSIRADLKITNEQWLNSNIIALVAGMVMRAVVGPCCDRFGPRKTMTGVLIAAAIPCALAGTITNYAGLMLIRFFVGIAGASFVPTLNWCTMFYDKNVVGTANGFAGGWGNGGSAVAYFMMPAVYDSIRGMGRTSHVAWRVSFVVPTIMLLACAAGSYFLCDDTPTGKWEDRFNAPSTVVEMTSTSPSPSGVDRVDSEPSNDGKDDKRSKEPTVTVAALEDDEAQSPRQPVLVMEALPQPSLKDSIKALCCIQTLMLAAPYACSFGGELALAAILSSWYQQKFPGWGQTKAGQVAAAFGAFNVVCRPLGGFLSDRIYGAVSPRWGTKSKQLWYGFLVTAQGVMLTWIGLVNPTNAVALVGGIQAMAIFMDAANGAAYSLVPHVNPQYNGIMSGAVGSTGNFGGVMFSVAFRFTNYHKGCWIIGVCSMAIGILMTAVPPIPKSQLKAGGYMSR